MRYELIPPPPKLEPYVKNFWILEATLISEQEFYYRLFADAHPTIVFHYQNLFSSVLGHKVIKEYSYSTLHGHQTSFEDLKVKGSFGIFGITLFPWSLECLFEISPQDLACSYVDLPDLLGIEGRVIEEKMGLAKTDEKRLDHAVRFLSRRLKKGFSQDPLMELCLSKIIDSNGQQTINELSVYSGWTRRHLERRFANYLGLGPKQYARLNRFQHIIRLYERGNIKSLTTLAYEAGFFDQSHMNREFKQFSGLRPRQYFKNLPDIAEGFARMTS